MVASPAGAGRMLAHRLVRLRVGSLAASEPFPAHAGLRRRMRRALRDRMRRYTPLSMLTPPSARSSAPASVPRLAVRRVLAFALDYLVIAAYGVALGSVAFVVGLTPLGPWISERVRTPLAGHALSFVTLTLPVLLYFALSEASTRRATWGKRRLGLEVVSENGGRLDLGRAVLRAAVKLLPWEISHAALWRIEGWPVAPEPPGLPVVAGLAVTWLLVLWWLGALVVGSGRPPHDRLAGARVRWTRSTESQP